ncbi:MAG: hypothetical protein ABL889_04295 [Terricaulis sp.]
MTSILKHDPAASDSSVRALDWSAFVRSEHDGALVEQNAEVAALRAEIERLDAELSASKGSEPARLAAARAEGRKDAEAAYKANDEAKLAALQAGLGEALEIARPAFANIETIANLIAERAIANALDEASTYRDQIARAIRNQANLLGAQTILKIAVCRADFADDAALDALARELGAACRVEIDADHDLAQGQARLRLMLGEIELDLARYWSDVRALLVDLAKGAHA